MYPIIYMSIAFVIFSINILDNGSAYAEVLTPPRNIPFMNDVNITKYSRRDLLQNFIHSGNWSVKANETNYEIIAEPSKTYSILFSKDKISIKPKSFKFDFLVSSSGSEDHIEYAFFYGLTGIAIKNNIIYPAIFDNKGNIIEIDKKHYKEIVNKKSNEYKTLDINTGYDVLNNISCIMYINGNGIVIENPSTDSYFGVYLGAGSSIMINNFRWGRGSK